MKAVIVAGGKGTRLLPLTAHLPKPMLRVGGRPILEHQIILLKKNGIKDITILVQYLPEMIRGYFGTGEQLGVCIDYAIEKEPLGTAGAVRLIAKRLKSPFLLLYGDTLINMDLGKLVSFHGKQQALATLVAHPNNHPRESDLIDINSRCEITTWHKKPHRPDRYFHNLVNAGVYLLTPEILRYIPENKFSDFGRDVFPRLVKRCRLQAYVTAEYIRDIGDITRLRQARKDFSSGILQSKTLLNKQPAFFLDRDGTINKQKGHLHRLGDFELLPGVARAIRLLNESPYLTVVITNQPVVARGLCSLPQLDKIHKKMETLLGHEGVYVDAIYFCPHYPQRGFSGEVKALKVNCQCRKPKTGLIRQAAALLNIDINRSYLVGDTDSDVRCAINAGLKPLIVRSNQIENKLAVFRSLPVYDSLLEAVTGTLTSGKVAGQGVHNEFVISD